MKIIIDCRNTYKNDGTLSNFTREFWYDLALSQPAHNFFFLTAKQSLPDQPAGNITMLQVKRTGIPWLDKQRMKKLAIQLQADRLITISQDCTGHLFLLNGSKPDFGSPFGRLVFTGAASINSSGMPVATVLDPALPATITSLAWAAAESIKTQYTGGRSFFLFVGDINEQHQLIELLKAFSLFKKWQQSNMQLLITGSTTAWTAVLEDKLSTYKYKEDVVLLKNTDHTETARLVAACYAVLYPAADNVFPLSLLWAIQSNKAVIASSTSTNSRFTDAAAWVVPGETAAGFAKTMILLYKDENQLQLLVQQATMQAQRFNRQHLLADAWQWIEK